MTRVPCYLELETAAKNEIINEAFHELGTFFPETLEKDIWLCHVLDVLFSLPGLPMLVFRGGTSLSKAYNAIDRFSEDIDVTINHDEILPEFKFFADCSGKKRKAMLEELKGLVQSLLHDSVYPALAESLGLHGSLSFDPSDKDEMTIRFAYCTCLEGVDAISPYMQRNIKLEFGGRSSTEPNSMIKIRPYVSELFTNDVVFPEPRLPVVSASRTFWDKVTLIHGKISRFKGGKPNKTDRLSRHWYDLFRLFNHQIGETSLTEDYYLLKEVVRHKDLFFHDGPGKLADCLNKNTRLVPEGELLEELEQDYRQMIDSGMFYNNPPSFADITKHLRILEERLNS